jgi:hypothetical protein
MLARRKRRNAMTPRLGSILCAASLLCASAAGAALVVVDYDGASAKDFVTTP